MTEKDSIFFLEHILESIDLIESFVKNISLDELSKDKMRESAIIRQIEIIGEASKNLSEAFKKKYNKPQWKEIIGARDKLIHNYFGVDSRVIKDIIQYDLSLLKKQIKDILEKEKIKSP